MRPNKKITKKEHRERIIDHIEKNESGVDLAFEFATHLKRLALATQTCPKCLIHFGSNPHIRNKETLISGLCTACQSGIFGSSE